MKFHWLHLAFFILCLTAVMPTDSAFAHRLNISAWLDNDKIIVESSSGPKEPAVNAEVVVYDKDTQKELVKGKTGPDGRFVFAVPNVVREGHGLTIAVNAGQGHQGSWSMSASELYAAASLTAGFDQARLEEDARNKGAGQAPASALASQNIAMPGSAGNMPDKDELKGIIHDALEVQLAPIRQQIAAQKSGGISLVEIIGGLGWIMGLVGVALFFMAKRREN